MELIELKAAKTALTHCVEHRTDEEIEYTLDQLPKVDAVPVVRCGNCRCLNTKYFEAGEGNYYCHRTGDRTELTDFCSYGEPRTPPAE